MPIQSEHRASESPYIARVWRGRTEGVSTLTSVATSTWELVFWEDETGLHAAARGPETTASRVEVTGDSDSFGITFAHGTSMPHLPVAALVDGQVESARVGERSFLLRDEQWELPRPDQAEQFVARLVREGVLVRDPLVDDVVWGGIARVGSRSVQRRIAASTGLTRSAIRQIERAREAAVLLDDGLSPLEVVHRLEYYDQPHLARSLQRFIGRTATELQRRDEAAEAMSLLYKTDDPTRS